VENLAVRISDFLESIENYKPESNPSWGLGPPYNALVEAAKAELADDPIVQTLATTTQVRLECSIDVGTMRASLNQVLGAMGGTGPAFDIS